MGDFEVRLEFSEAVGPMDASSVAVTGGVAARLSHTSPRRMAVVLIRLSPELRRMHEGVPPTVTVKVRSHIACSCCWARGPLAVCVFTST